MSSSDDYNAIAGNAGPKVRYWLSQIKKAESDMQRWQRRCDKIRKRYLFEQGQERTRKRQFQMLWSNQEILRPAVYAKCPEAMVQSRWRDGDDLVRVSGQILERTMDVQVDLGDFNSTFELVRNDYLLYARGAARLRYDAEFEPDEIDDGVGSDPNEQSDDDGYETIEVDADSEEAKTGEVVEDEDTDPETEAPPEKIKAEHVKLDFVHRKDFIHPHARNWAELPWLAFAAYLTRDELRKKWPKCADKIVLDCKPGGDRDDGRNSDEHESEEPKATIYEIWDKVDRKVIWIAKAYAEELEEGEPYLKFTGFFPCAKPAYGTMDTDSLKPVPDFSYYQDQADEINDLTARIGALTDSLKLVGFYPAGPEGEGQPAIEQALRPGFENKVIAVKAWDAFRKGSGSDGSPIVFLPVRDVAEIIEKCIALRKQTIDDVYQLTGISDIMRGDTEKDETAAAQGIKSIWGSVRLKTRQQELARFAKDTMRLMAEIICSNFQMETLLDCSNMKLPTDQDVQVANQKFQLQQQQAALAAQQRALQSPQPPPPGAPSGVGPAGSPPNGPSGAGEPIPAGGPSASPLGAGVSSGPGAAPPSPSPPPQPPDLGPTQEDVQKFLKDKVLVRYIVDIETDSTIQLDQEKEQTQRTEFIDKTTRFMTAVMPIASEQPAMMPFIGQLFMFGVRAFPAARELQEAAEQMIAKMEEMAGQPPKPNAEQAKAQAEIESAKIEQETKKITAQADIQATQEKSKAEVMTAQLKMRAMEAEHGHKMQQMQLDHQTTMAQHQMKQKTLAQEVQVMEQKMAASQALEGMKAQHQKDLQDQTHMHAMAQGEQSHKQTIEQGQTAHQQTMQRLSVPPSNTTSASHGGNP